jgi:pyruvate-formate lyase-activating enzyme
VIPHFENRVASAKGVATLFKRKQKETTFSLHPNHPKYLLKIPFLGDKLKISDDPNAIPHMVPRQVCWWIK